ncbi:MAG TPA: M24 family metallopeptidase [bacterium]|nr:M24 family metallopeptidase [bacterium]
MGSCFYTQHRTLPGDSVLTDFGGTWDGFSSDMARMGIVGKAGPQQLDEYRSYRDAYVRTIGCLNPGVTAAVVRFCTQAFEQTGIAPTAPHSGTA